MKDLVEFIKESYDEKKTRSFRTTVEKLLTSAYGVDFINNLDEIEKDQDFLYAMNGSGDTEQFKDLNDFKNWYEKNKSSKVECAEYETSNDWFYECVCKDGKKLSITTIDKLNV